MNDWGDFDNVSLKPWTNRKTDKIESICSYINFYNSEHATYFRDAIDGTDFGHLILRVEILENKDEKNDFRFKHSQMFQK